MASSEINLDGSEISIIKAIGLSGGDVDGVTLMERLPELELAELTDAVQCLIAMGYVECDRNSVHNREEFEKAHFHVNSGYAKDLKDAMDPTPEKPKSKRVRRE
jgi:hypothetical protein